MTTVAELKEPEANELVVCRQALSRAQDSALLAFWNAANPAAAEWHRERAIEQIKAAADALGYQVKPKWKPKDEPKEATP